MNKDQRARQTLKAELHRNLFVEAAAGTGKTYVLIERAVALVTAGVATVDQIALVTFSRKAAGELQVRLRLALEQARQTESSSILERVDHAITHLEEAVIDTLHGLCARILRSNPVEAALDPEFRLVSGQEQVLARRAELRRWLYEELSKASPHPALARYLSRLRLQRMDDSPIGELEKMVEKILEARNLDAPWKKPVLDGFVALKAALEQLLSFEAMLLQGQEDHPIRVALSTLSDQLVWFKETPITESDAPEAEARLQEIVLSLDRRTKGLSQRGPFGEISSFEVLKAAKDLKDSLTTLVHGLDQVLAADLFSLLSDVARRHVARSKQAGLVDFKDLLLLARDLLKTNQTVLTQWQSKLRHLMVDEFQDTDPVQIEVIELLCAQSIGLTLVGDPKQSIYGFRQADLSAFAACKARFADKGGELLELSRSFRSNRQLQAFVNRCFEEPMRASMGSYVALEGGPEPIEGQAAIVALPSSYIPRSPGEVWPRQVDERLSEDIPAFLSWLLSSGWKVRDGDKLRSVKASDVCLLYRSLQTYDRTLKTASLQSNLDRHGIAHDLVGLKALSRRDEVEAVITAFSALEWPEDELSVWACLRGPLFGFSDRVLFAFRESEGRLHLFRNYKETADRTVAEALGALRNLSVERNRRPYAETLDRLLGPVTGAEVGFRLRPDGAWAISNLERLRELLRAAEGERLSFRSAIERLREAANQPKESDGGTVAPHSEGVRIMTAHGAKGLEFPVVVLADPTYALRKSASQLVQTEDKLSVFKLGHLEAKDLADRQNDLLKQDRAEVSRLAYVASTRARDLLVVPTLRHDGSSIAGRGKTSWLLPLLASLESTPSLEGVLWWDRKSAPETPKHASGLSHDDFLKDLGPASLERYTRWNEARINTLELGYTQSCLLATLESTEERRPVSIKRLALGGATFPTPRRLGLLFHQTLRHIDLVSEDPVEPFVQMEARVLSCPAEEAKLILHMLNALRGHAIIERARQSRLQGLSVWQEVPVVYGLPEGSVADLQVDLALEEKDGWVLVDFVVGDARSEATQAKMQHALSGFSEAGLSVKLGMVLQFTPG